MRPKTILSAYVLSSAVLAVAALLYVTGFPDLPSLGLDDEFGHPCAQPTDCAEPSPELLAAFPGDRTCESPEPVERRICLQIVGDVSPDLVRYLAGYY